jgi:hypothetical protein
VAQSEPGRHAGQEVLHDHVSPLSELEGDLRPLGMLEIEGDAALVAIDGREGGAHPVLATQDAQVVAQGRPLHLDDVGAEVGEEGGTVRARNDAGEIEDADTFEHAHAGAAMLRAGSMRMDEMRDAMPETRRTPMSVPESGTITRPSARAPCRSAGARWTPAPP